MPNSNLLVSPSRRALTAGVLLFLAASFGVLPAVAQMLPSDINSPYGQRPIIPSDRPLSPSAPAQTTTSPPLQTPPLTQTNPGSGSLRLTPMPAGTAVTPSQTGTGPDTTQQMAPVTLVDEPSADAGMLTTVLTGTISKVQEYPINLETVLKLVDERNLLIDRDILGTKIRHNQYYRSLSDMLPDISGSYTQSRFKGTLQIFGDETFEVKQDRITPQVNVDWTIYPGGQQIFQSLAAKRRHSGSKFLLEETRQQQLSAAASDYYRLVEARVQIQNALFSIEESRSQVALSEARQRAGVGTRLDVMRAKTQLSQQERLLINAQNTLAQAEQSLLNRLDLDPNIALTTTEITAQPKVLVPMTWTTDQMVARAALQNPSLKISEAEISALKAESWAVLSGIVPSVTLQAYKNRTGPDYDKLGEGKFGGFTIQTNLLENMGTQIPLDYRNRRLQMKQQQVVRQALLRDIQTRVINAYLDSKAFAQSIITAREELGSAQEAYRLAVGRFKAGLGISVDVLNSETALTLARANITAAILGFNRAQVNLLESMGDVSLEHVLNGLTAVAPPTAAAPKSTSPNPAVPAGVYSMNQGSANPAVPAANTPVAMPLDMPAGALEPAP